MKRIDSVISGMARKLAHREKKEKMDEEYLKAREVAKKEYEQKNWISKLFSGIKYPDLYDYFEQDPSDEEVKVKIEEAKKIVKKIRKKRGVTTKNECLSCGLEKRGENKSCWWEDETLGIANNYQSINFNCDAYKKESDGNNCTACENCRNKCMREMQDRRSMYLSMY